MSEKVGMRAKLHEIIFEADTPTGKFFDVALLILIVLSVIVVLLDSVLPIHERFGSFSFNPGVVFYNIIYY